MKRYFALVAAALLTSAFATSAFAGWGPNGMYGNADPNARPVGQSSTPSTNPASAPVTPVDFNNPNLDLGAVPGSYKDPAVQAHLSKAELAYRIAKAKAAVEGKPFDKKNNSPRFAPQNLSGNMSKNTGFFGHDVTSRAPQMPKPSKLSQFPPMQPHHR